LTANIQLLVNGVDRTQYLEQTTWSITQQWTRQGDTAIFYLVDEHSSSTESGVALSFTVPPLATVTFNDVGLGITLFSGLVTYPQLTRPGPNLSYWELQCTDWTYLSDRALVQLDAANLTTDQIVMAALANANCGITGALVSNGGFVYPGPLVVRAKFIFNTLSAALTNIVQLAATYTSWGWHIDENRRLHFYPVASAVNTGITFTDNLTAQPSGNSPVSNTFGFYDSDNFDYGWDASQIRNVAIVRGSTYFVAQVDNFVGNGSQAAWPLTQAADTTAISSARLTVGGVVQTVSAQLGTSQTTQFIVQPNLSGQWFLQVNPGFGSVPGSGAAIVFNYKYVAPNIAQVVDNPSISRFASLPNHGVFKVYIADTNLQSLQAAQLRGQSEVHTFGLPEDRVQFYTTEDWPGHIKAGQLFTFVSSFTPDFNNGGSIGVNDVFIVVQQTIAASTNGAGYRTYQITAARALTASGVF
jgi:hypothetical protein